MRLGRSFRGIVIGLACLGAASPVLASKLPDWADALAESAPPLPPGVPDSPTRILLSEINYTVQPDGTFHIRRRLAAQALSVSADNVNGGFFHFDDIARVTASRAWHLPPNDYARKTHSTPVDILVGQNFLTGSKARILHVDGVKKGSLVFFEFEATERPNSLYVNTLFLDAAPVTLMRFQLDTPPDWSIRTDWLRQKGPEAVTSGNTRTWEIRDLPAPTEELLGVAPIERAPLLVVDLLPPAEAPPGPAVFSDWYAFSKWYGDMTKGKDEVTPAIRAAASQASGGTGAGLLDRIRAEGNEVRDKVRYVDVEMGIGAIQPRPAQDTLANLYGDSKDKGTLYQALLAAEGIPSYPILVHSTQRETISAEVPTWGFNHYVVGVPLPADLTVPPEFAGAVADAGDLGRLLIVDTTDEYMSIGSLSPSLAGKRALVAAGAQGRLITLPEAKPEFHLLERQIHGGLQADGSLTVERTSRLIGQPATLARIGARRSSEQRRKEVEGEIVRSWPDATSMEYSTVLETPEGAFQETLKYRRPTLGRQGEYRAVELFPGAGTELERVPLGTRKTAVEYDFPRTVRYETVLDGIPVDATLPEPKEMKGDGWSVTTTYTHDESAIRATWELRLSRTHFEPAAFPELRKLWLAVSSTAGWLLEFPG
jgi:uncharacterized protein DUF3857